MKKNELMNLDVGTVLYNGRYEGVVKMDGNVKVIEVCIQISTMSNDSVDFNEHPENWEEV